MIALPLLFLGGFVSPALAANCSTPGCGGVPQNPVSISRQRQSFVDVETQYLPCSDSLLKLARKDYAQLFPETEKRKIQNVSGIKLRGTSQELEIAERVVGARPHSSWPGIAQNCQTVACALTRLFGSEESALLVLSTARRTGYAITASQDANSIGVEQLWTLSEIRQIARTLREVPAPFIGLSTLKRIKRVADGETIRGDARSAALATRDGDILIAKQTFERPLTAKIVLQHELGHHYNFRDPALTKEEFLQKNGFWKMSQWKENVELKTASRGTPVVQRKYQHGADDRFVDDYASTNPFEDYAESIGFYRFDPERLLSAAPEKYAFLKRTVFGDHEYRETAVWPEIDEAVRNAGGAAYLLDSCLSSLNRVFWDEQKKDLFYQGSTSVRRGYQFDRECLSGALSDLFDELDEDEGYCSRGGEDGVYEYLTLRLSAILNPIQAELLSQWRNPGKEIREQCLERNQSGSACWVPLAIQRVSIFHALSQREKTLIIDNFIRTIPSLKQ